jgi:predicted transcriptional regulator
MKVDLSTILLQIAKRRRELGMTQAEAARLAGVRQSYLSSIETGKIEPRLGTLQEIARSLRAELVLVPLEALPAISALVGTSAAPEVRRLFEAEPD